MAELSVSDVRVRFGGLLALDGVGLRVPPGSVTGLIGPNGAGKTTLFDVVTGLRRPEVGRVSLDGRDITAAPPHRRARMGIGRTFQRIELFGSLSALDNVRVAAETAGLRGAVAVDRARALLERVGLAERGDTPADLLPTGHARLLEVARVLAIEPSVLLLDEPSAGLDGEETAALAAVLEGLAGDGIAVLLVEHDMGLVMDLCASVIVLDAGRVIASGTPADVRADAAVRSAYLGDGGGKVPVTAVSPSRAEPEGPPALELQGIRAGYGRIEVVHDVDLVVGRGQVTALLGPNGAGKSTVLAVAAGMVLPVAGAVRVDGAEVTGLAPEQLVGRGVCCVPEGRAVFANMTVAENLRMFAARSRSVTATEMEERSFARFPALAERRKLPAGRLSGGEQQMLALARALGTDPTVLLVDELSMGLAPIVVARLYEVLGQLVETEGIGVLLVEQFALTALELADTVAVLVHGRVARRGSPAEVAGELAETYLGGGA